MLKKAVSKIADSDRMDSWALKMRRKRFAFFSGLVESYPRPLRILDIGGTANFWKTMGWWGNPDYQFTLINLSESCDFGPTGCTIKADARDFASAVQNKEFDIIFSNSVIEHVGTYQDQARMAAEILSFGLPYYVQTPNLYFPIEAHCLIPFFPFYPRFLKAAMVRYFKLRGYAQAHTKEEAYREIDQIRLLNSGEMKQLFPGASIYFEKCFGLVKSFCFYNGFKKEQLNA